MKNRASGQHISHLFDEEMEDIRHKVLTMGGLVEQQMENAVKAFMSCDQDLAEKVLQQDEMVNSLEMEIDHDCIQVIAKRQPAAVDLRMLISIIKAITELERIGDEAGRIAKMAIRLDATDYYHDQYHEINHLVDMVKEMLRGSLDAFARMSIDGITEITGKDEKVDREYTSIIRQLITQMMEDPRNITRAIDILWTARALERIGDHACNICEHVVYIVKGDDVRHLSQDELENKIQQ
ncbi:MAG: phosphate signaling complex protein PhoU [Methylococcaceae bacterium]|nr:phosphate signaling complex protein PhoU [Methylococcaceae bacterium]